MSTSGKNTPRGRTGDTTNNPQGAGDGGETVDRRAAAPCRRGTVVERRTTAGATEGSGTGLERRRGPGRRRPDFARAAEEGEMTGEQFLFLMAVDAFKKSNNRTFPTWTDVLEVIRLLGYRKTMPSELNLPCAEDWKEPADSPSGVRDISLKRDAA